MPRTHNSDTSLTLATLLKTIKTCRICRDEPLRVPLPHEPRPVLTPSTTAKICICGQAPGTRVHASGTPFTDPSGDRLRSWMDITTEQFYDPDRIAIVPMGFCFPGLDKEGGDLPPRRECAQTWHRKLFEQMPQFKLVLVVGTYAQRWHLGSRVKSNLSETVAAWRDYAMGDAQPAYFPMPHPSWRNNAWLKKNPWFEKELLPELQQKIGELIK